MLYLEGTRSLRSRLAGWLRWRPFRRRRVVGQVTDLRELTPYMRWDIGITDIGPTERGWR